MKEKIIIAKAIDCGINEKADMMANKYKEEGAFSFVIKERDGDVSVKIESVEYEPIDTELSFDIWPVSNLLEENIVPVMKSEVMSELGYALAKIILDEMLKGEYNEERL